MPTFFCFRFQYIFTQQKMLSSQIMLGWCWECVRGGDRGAFVPRGGRTIDMLFCYTNYQIWILYTVCIGCIYILAFRLTKNACCPSILANMPPLSNTYESHLFWQRCIFQHLRFDLWSHWPTYKGFQETFGKKSKREK